MYMKRTAVTLAIATAGLITAPAVAGGDWRDEYPSIGYGVQSVESQGAALSRYVGFADYLEDTLGAELDLYLASEYAGVIQAIVAGQIEFMHMGVSGYGAAYIESDGNVEPLVAAQETDGSLGYHSVMFVRSDSDYESVDDLAGATFAWADPNSSSGFLFPNAGLRGQGIDPDEHFGEIVFSGGHEQSILGVLNGTYDAAVTWTNDPDEHTRGGLHMMLERGVLAEEDIRIIWTSDLIPNPVIAARADLPADLIDDFRDMLLNLHEDDPEVFEQVARGKSPGFVEVDHDDYAIGVELREQMSEWD